MKGLSFDLSRRATGIVYWEDTKPTDTEILRLPDGYLGQQLYIWDGYLLSLLKWYEPNWMAYEDARAVSKQHGQILFGMVGILLMRAYLSDTLTVGYPQTIVKKELAGKGNAKKPEMVAAARERYPELDITDDNVADALGVGLCALAKLDFKSLKLSLR